MNNNKIDLQPTKDLIVAQLGRVFLEILKTPAMTQRVLSNNTRNLSCILNRVFTQKKIKVKRNVTFHKRVFAFKVEGWIMFQNKNFSQRCGGRK